MAFATFVTRVLIALHVVRYGADTLCDTPPNPLALDLDTLKANSVPVNSLTTCPALLPIQRITAPAAPFTSINELAAILGPRGPSGPPDCLPDRSGPSFNVPQSYPLDEPISIDHENPTRPSVVTTSQPDSTLFKSFLWTVTDLFISKQAGYTAILLASLGIIAVLSIINIQLKNDLKVLSDQAVLLVDAVTRSTHTLNDVVFTNDQTVLGLQSQVARFRNNNVELRAILEAMEALLEAERTNLLNLEEQVNMVESENMDLKSRLATTISTLETETKKDTAVTKQYKSECQIAQETLLAEWSDNEVVIQPAPAAAEVIADQLANELATQSDTLKSTLDSHEELGVLYLALDNKACGFKKDIAHLQKKLSLLLILFAAASNEATELTASHTDLLSLLASKEDELAAAGKTLDEEKVENIRFNNLLEEKEGFIYSLTSLNQELESEVEISRQEISELEEHLQQLKAAEDDVAIERAAKEHAIFLASQQDAHHQLAVNDYETKPKDIGGCITEAGVAGVSAAVEVTGIRRELSEAAESRQSALARQNALDTEVTSKRLEVASLRREVASLKTDASEYGMALATVRTALEKTKTSKLAMASSTNITRDEMEATIRSLRSKVASQDREIERLKGRIQTCQTTPSAPQSVSSQRTKRFETLRSTYKRLTARSMDKGEGRSPPTPEIPESTVNCQPNRQSLTEQSPSMECITILALTEGNSSSSATRATQTFEVPSCQSISLPSNEDPPSGPLQQSNVLRSDSIVTKRHLSTPSRKLSRFFKTGKTASSKTPGFLPLQTSTPVNGQTSPTSSTTLAGGTRYRLPLHELNITIYGTQVTSNPSSPFSLLDPKSNANFSENALAENIRMC